MVERDMYAVIKSGGKQHRVVEGEILRLEKLDVATGESIDFDEVLMVGEGAKVCGLRPIWATVRPALP